MSTYIYLFCKKCGEKCSFIGVWFPARWGWMAKAEKIVPKFIARHSNHLYDIEIVSEDDERLYEESVMYFGEVVENNEYEYE